MWIQVAMKWWLGWACSIVKSHLGFCHCHITDYKCLCCVYVFTSFSLVSFLYKISMVYLTYVTIASFLLTEPVLTLSSSIFHQDTLRECPPDHSTDVDYACNPSLQFISPMYFVSFVLTAQFVLINVVVAVLMKHLDDSNKEAQEEAEMDAEIELELAQGTLCCMGAPGCGGGGVDKGLTIAGSGPGGPAGGKERGGTRGDKGDALRRMRHTAVTTHQGPYNSDDSGRTLYSPAQVSFWISVCVRQRDGLWEFSYVCLCIVGKVFCKIGEFVFEWEGVCFLMPAGGTSRGSC